jgi:hypothetical protein
VTTDTAVSNEVAIARVEVTLAAIRADMTDMKDAVHEMAGQMRGLLARDAARDAELCALRDRVKALEDARCRDTERRPAWWSVAIGVCGFVAAVVVALVKGGGG